MSELDYHIEAKVFAEIKRWKEIHDNELQRQKKLTRFGFFIGVLGVFGTALFSYVSLDFAVEKVVNKNSEKYSKIYDSAYSNVMSDLIRQLDNDVKKASTNVEEVTQSLMKVQKEAEDTASNGIKSVNTKVAALIKSVEDGNLDKVIELAVAAEVAEMNVRLYDYVKYNDNIEIYNPSANLNIDVYWPSAKPSDKPRNTTNLQVYEVLSNEAQTWQIRKGK